ncbi:MAG: hypothetical protein ACPGU1_07410 [Myxococcota bacterium]
MIRWIPLVTVLCASAWLASCGSCGAPGVPPVAPLAQAEPESLPALPNASDPFAKQVKGPALATAAIPLPDKTPLLLRMASPDRVDELIAAYEAVRASVGGKATGWKANSLLAKVLQFDPATWVARDKPATLLVVDPTRYLLGEVLVLGLRDTAALMAALPKGTFDADEVPPKGHTAVYRSKTGNIYVDFVGPNVVFTKHNDVFALVKAFIEEDLAAWKAPHDVDVVIDVTNMRTAFAEEIALTRQDPTPKGKRGSGVPLLSKAALLGMVDSLDGISAQVVYQDGHFTIQTSATPRTDATGSWAWAVQWVKALAQRTTVPVAGLPNGTWAAASVSADVTGGAFQDERAKTSAAINTLYGDLLDLTPAEREASAPLWGRFADLVTGGAYAFAFEQGEVPACGAVVMRVEDAHRARFLTKRLLETFLLRIVPRIQDEEISLADMPFPDGDFRTVADLFKALNEVYGQVGMAFYESSLVEASEDIAVEALGIRFDSAQREEAAKAGRSSLADIIGSKLELAVAYRGNLMALVLSPAASTQAALLVSGSFGEGTGPFRAPRPGEAALAAVALDRLVVSVPQLWPNATNVLPPEALRGDASLGLTSSGDVIQATLSLPARSLAVIEAINQRQPKRAEKNASSPASP